VLGGNGDGEPFLFDVLGDDTPVPLWVADLAEGVAGRRVDERNVLRVLTDEEQDQRIKSVMDLVQKQSKTTDRWTQFGRWYLSNDPDPTISPYSNLRRSGLAERTSRDQADTAPMPSWPSPEPPVPVETNNVPTGALGDVPAPPVSGATPPPLRVTPSLPGTYVAVIGSMERRENALTLAADVEARAGFGLGNRSVKVKEKMLGNKRYYRVIIEPSSSRAQAEDVCSRLRTLGFKDCFLATHH
jgi:cell division protein FtsN